MLGLSALILSGGLLGGGLPPGFPPAPHDPIIDHVAPDDCLVYIAWNGTAPASPDSPNRTERLLAEPEVSRFTSLLVERLTDGLSDQSRMPRRDQEHSAGVLKLLSVVVTHPTAIYVGTPNPLPSVGFVCRVGEQAQQLEADLIAMENAIAEESGTVTEQNGIQVHNWPVAANAPPLQWAVVDDCIVVAFGPQEFEHLAARLAAKVTPKWLTELHKRLPVQRVANVVYIDTAAILRNAAPILRAEPQLNTMLNALGLDGVKSLNCVSGLDKTECVSRTWIQTEGKSRGVFQFADAQPLQSQDLNVFPADANVAIAFRLNLQETFRQILNIADDVEPGAARQAEAELAPMSSMIGLDLEKDVLGAFGDTWRIYQSDSEGGRLLTGWTAVASVRDSQKLRNVSNVFRGIVAAQNAQQGSSRQVSIQTFQAGSQDVFFTNFVGIEFPVAPAWCITEDELIVSLLPQGITAYLNRDKSAPLLGTSDETEELTSNGTIAMVRFDEKNVFDTVYPAMVMGANALFADLQREGINVDISMLPSPLAVSRHLKSSTLNVLKADDGIEFVSRSSLPIGLESLAATLPATVFVGISPFRMSGRSGMGSAVARVLSPKAARRDTSKNNMKQLMLALHNFHDVHHIFPAADTSDNNDKPGLSWRVQLLPFVEQAPLFQQFRMDEPWNSEHNLKLVKLMPDVFRAPGSHADEFHTNYVGLRIENSMLPPDGKATRFRDTTDGTSNTMMFVEADDDHAVIWTKPDDLNVDMDHPRDGLNSPSVSGGFLAAMTDASVRFIPELIDVNTLKNLIIRNDGNVIGEF